jgi:RNA polymerase sigma factor (sigma-70 family)
MTSGAQNALEEFAPINGGDPLPPDDLCLQDHSKVEPEPIDILYRTQAPRLVRLVRGRSRGTDEALDVVHDAFIRIVTLGARFREVRGPDAYLSRVVGNLVRDRARSAAYRIDTATVALEDETLPITSPEPMLEARDMLCRLDSAMQRLKPRTREIFMAHRIDGLTYSQIAERTGLSVKGVEKQISRAMAKLDRLLDFE